MDTDLSNAVTTFALPGFKSSGSPEKPVAMDADLQKVAREWRVPGFRAAVYEPPEGEPAVAMDADLREVAREWRVPGYRSEVYERPEGMPTPAVAPAPAAVKPKVVPTVTTRRFDIRRGKDGLWNVASDDRQVLLSPDPIADLSKLLTKQGMAGEVSLRIVDADLSHVEERFAIGNADAIARISGEVLDLRRYNKKGAA